MVLETRKFGTRKYQTAVQWINGKSVVYPYRILLSNKKEQAIDTQQLSFELQGIYIKWKNLHSEYYTLCDSIYICYSWNKITQNEERLVVAREQQVEKKIVQ